MAGCRPSPDRAGGLVQSGCGQGTRWERRRSPGGSWNASSDMTPYRETLRAGKGDRDLCQGLGCGVGELLQGDLGDPLQSWMWTQTWCLGASRGLPNCYCLLFTGFPWPLLGEMFTEAAEPDFRGQRPKARNPHVRG